MKQYLLQRFIASLLFLTVSTLSWAYDFVVDDIYYSKNSDGISVTVTYKTSSDRGYSGSVAIPSQVTYNSKTYTVTGIMYYAFENCGGLTSVTIPNSVTSIGGYAFSGCNGLTSVTIGNSVTSIGEYAFYECNGLTSVTIGNSVTYIGEYAFYECNGLTSITIPNSVKLIANHAFKGCSGLTSITIPNSVTNIGNYAFSGCSGLTSVTIGNSVTYIGNYVFYECSSLKSVSINSKNLVSRDYSYSDHNISAIFGSQVSEYILGDDVKSIGDCAFSNCSGLTSVTIPNSVKSIGSNAFNGCSGLKSVTIPNSVTSIGNLAFWGCSGLTSVTISNSITSIGDFTFACCSGLTFVNIPKSVKSIGLSAFASCSGLTSVAIPNSVTSIEMSAFYGCSGLTSVTIPNSVTSIERYAFSGCSGLTSIKVKDGNPKYDSRDNCNAIIETSTNTLVIACKNTTIPNSVTSIGSYAFYDCSGLTSITVPNSVTGIGVSAFSGCRSLTSVTIPESVKNIGQDAFYSCRNLQEVYCLAETVPETDSYAFDSSPIASATLYVPASALDDYKATAPWSGFGTILPIDEHYLQTPVQGIGGLFNSQVYTANTKRAAWYVPAGSTQIETTEHPTIVEKNSISRNQQFAFILHNGKYYIYSVGEDKILNGITNNSPNHGELVTENCQPVTISKTGNTQFPLFFSYDTSHNINISNVGEITIDSWSAYDDGNMVALRPVIGVTLANKDLRRIIGYIDSCIVGDSNGNGEVEIGDVTSVLTLMATPEATGYNNKAADANGNGEIEIGDVTTILTIMAGGN